MNNLKKKIVAVVTTVTVAAWMIPGSALAITAEELQAQINSLLATLAALQSQLATLEAPAAGGAITGIPAGFTFTANLKQGDSGTAVKYMQIVLNSDSTTKIASTGAGSPGNETTFFGALTKAAVVKFQEKYASAVLAPAGLTAGTGFVGSGTRAKLNALLGVAPAPAPGATPTPTPTPTPTGVTKIELAADTPAAKQVALAAIDAVAAKFKVSGGASGVTISKVVVKRGGVSADADVSAVKLYDGMKQLGSSQALNTITHKASFSGINWNIPAGETKILTVKVSIAAKGTATVGDSIRAVIESASDITTTGTLEATFPLQGNDLVVAGISVGELFVDAQSTPAAATVLSGGAEVEIANWRFTASSSEAVEINSISITQVGSAAGTDISNVKLKYAGAQVGSTVAKLTPENKVTFDLSASPVKLLASQAKDIYAYADIAAGIFTARTVIFEITEATDVTVVGANSGGAIEPAFDDTTAFSKQTGQTMTVGQGTLTINVDSALNPAAQNYVKGTTNRLMSAFKFTTGSREGVRLVKIRFKINNGSGTATDLANVTLWDGTTQIAGPASVIGSYVTFGANTIGWDTPGIIDIAKSSNKTLQVKADVPTGATTARTLDMDIAVNTDVWVDGLESQYDVDQTSITLTSGNGNLHTVSANGALSLALSSNTPSAQTYIKGSSDREMVRFNLTADSGEDMTVSSITMNCYRGTGTGTACSSGDYTNAKLYKQDGTSWVQLGSTVATLSSTAAFSFSVTVPAAGTVTLKMVADIPSTTGLAAAGGHFNIAAASDITTDGLSSSASITETGLTITGNLMGVGSGTLTVSAAATPGDQTVIVGTTKVPVVGLVFTAGSAEDVRITKIKLWAVSKEAGFSGDQDNLAKIALYDGATRLTAEKGWDSTTATSVTFVASDFLNNAGIDVLKGAQKTITVKADIPSTGDNNDSIGLGISTTTSAGVTAGTLDVVFTGLESNTTPTTTLNYNTAIGGVNFTTSSANDANIHYVTLATSGTMNVASAASAPETNIVTVGAYGVGRQDVTFLQVDFTANREDIYVKTVTIDRTLTGDVDFEDISLWDGTIQIGGDQTLVSTGLENSSTTFSLPVAGYWKVSAGTTKTLTVKADLNGSRTVDQPGGVTTGDAPKLCFASTTIEGVSSGVAIQPTGGGNPDSKICGNAQILHKSKPTLAAASLPSTVFAAGEKVLYRWTVTADAKGDIGWQRVVFDVSGSIQVGSDTFTIGAGGSTTTAAIWMGTSTTATDPATSLIATSTMKIYDVGTGEEVLPTSTDQSGWYVHNFKAGGARVVFTAKNMESISAGLTKTYEWRGDISQNGKAGDSLSVKITKRSTATSTKSLLGEVVADRLLGANWRAGEAIYTVTSTDPTFIWTDKTGSGDDLHSATTTDWSWDYKIPGLPTATLSLSK